MKKVVIAVLVVFLGFWLFTDPNGLAASSESASSGVWTAAQSTFQAVIDFIHAF
jgi:hypothetical protein